MTMEFERKAPAALAEQRRDVAAQVARLDAELTHLADAIAGGVAPAALVAAMTSREAERRALQAKLEHVDGLAIEAGQTFDLNAWLDEIREIFENLRETLEADPAAGRQVLRRLLVGPVTVTPRVEDGKLYFDFTGASTYAEYASSLAAGSPPPDLVIGAPAVRLVSRPVTGRISRGKTAVPNVVCPRTIPPDPTHCPQWSFVCCCRRRRLPLADQGRWPERRRPGEVGGASRKSASGPGLPRR